MEPNTLIKTRQVDQELVQSLLPKAVEQYKQKMGKDVSLKLDTTSYLGADTCGGVELSALNGRIRVSVRCFCFFETQNRFANRFLLIHSLIGKCDLQIPFQQNVPVMSLTSLYRFLFLISVARIYGFLAEFIHSKVSIPSRLQIGPNHYLCNVRWSFRSYFVKKFVLSSKLFPIACSTRFVTLLVCVFESVSKRSDHEHYAWRLTTFLRCYTFEEIDFARYTLSFYRFRTAPVR